MILPLRQKVKAIQGNLSPTESTPTELVYHALARGNTGHWTKGWQRWANVRKAAWQLADELPTRLKYQTEARIGRGIVISGGGKYWDTSYVSCKVARDYGSELPITVFYLPGEENAERQAAIEKLPNVQCKMLQTKYLRRVGGFESKMLAVEQSGLRDVLYLDADCYPVFNVDSVFDSASYKKYGAIYWPDLLHTRGWTHWAHWGVHPRGDVGLETGIFAIDTVAHRAVCKQIEAYDQLSDWCYGRGEWSDHGDKGSHRVAWAKAKLDYAIAAKEPTWQEFAFLQVQPDSREIGFVHRCRSKFTAHARIGRFSSTPQTKPNLRGGLPGETAAFAALRDLEAQIQATDALPPSKKRGCGCGVVAVGS